MWPLNLLWKSSGTRIRKIDERFATSGQIRPEEVEALAKQGFVAIVCARPDNEEPGQPAFEAIAQAAATHGLTAIHIPVSGAPTSGQIARFDEATHGVDGPVLGYCRSGARAANLYNAVSRKA